MTANSDAARSIDDQPNLKELPPTSRASVVEFFAARDRLLRDSVRIARESEIDRHFQAIRRERYSAVPDAVEEGCYWLIATAVFAFLVLALLGL